MAQTGDQELLPLSPLIDVSGSAGPSLMGSKCARCSEIFSTGARACPKCASLDSLQSVELAKTGKLYTYTIVERSFPGIETPFISAIVRLDDGAMLKGNLVDVNPDPGTIRFDMPVRIEFRAAAGPEGKQKVWHVFVPAAARPANKEEAQ